MSASEITDAVRAVLHTGPADRGTLRPGECYHCGCADGDVVPLLHPGGDRVDGHVECGEPDDYRRAPACDGDGDTCGAPEGVACEPWCAHTDPLAGLR
ncbi:hypothetical protein [Pseudonocardia alni]|uniref:hypothetical protein n=1 Tax=Pseudonocardia alni TaxID=33907 RepID=UPI0033323BCB